MAKPKPLTPADLGARLLAIKMLIIGMKDAMPTAARELQREARESIDDLIAEVRR